MPRLDRYQDPELIQRLAGEYALGTLVGRTRQRFIRLMQERAYIHQAVEDWQQRLDALSETLPGTAPPPRVWRSIEGELNEQDRQRRPRGLASFGRWRFAGFAAMLLLVVSVSLPLVWRPVETPTKAQMPDYVAVLENARHEPMIVAAATEKPMRIKLMMKDMPQMGENEDWELWCLPKDGGKPISIGVLARGKETDMPLNQHDWDMMEEGLEGLAISREPRGGSTTGQPTGEIMYTGSLMRLG